MRAALRGNRVQPLLTLRRKQQTDPSRICSARTRWSAGDHRAGLGARRHGAGAGASLPRHFQPHVLVAHGFSEHLWGRYAGLLAAKVRDGSCPAQLS